jgi:hypothetical protein
MRCWDQDHSKRPTFKDIVKELKFLRKAAAATSSSAVEAAVAAAAAAVAAAAADAGQQAAAAEAAAAERQHQWQQQHQEALPPAAAGVEPSFMHGLAPLPETDSFDTSAFSLGSPTATDEAEMATRRAVQWPGAYASLVEAVPASNSPAASAAAAAAAAAMPAALASSSQVSQSPFEAGFSAGAAAADTPVPALPGAKLPKASSSTVKSPFEASGAMLLADLIGEGPAVGLPAGAAR